MEGACRKLAQLAAQLFPIAQQVAPLAAEDAGVADSVPARSPARRRAITDDSGGKKLWPIAASNTRSGTSGRRRSARRAAAAPPRARIVEKMARAVEPPREQRAAASPPRTKSRGDACRGRGSNPAGSSSRRWRREARAAASGGRRRPRARDPRGDAAVDRQRERRHVGACNFDVDCWRLSGSSRGAGIGVAASARSPTRIPGTRAAAARRRRRRATARTADTVPKYSNSKWEEHAREHLVDVPSLALLEGHEADHARRPPRRVAEGSQISVTAGGQTASCSRGSHSPPPSPPPRRVRPKRP